LCWPERGQGKLALFLKNIFEQKFNILEAALNKKAHHFRKWPLWQKLLKSLKNF